MYYYVTKTMYVKRLSAEKMTRIFGDRLITFIIIKHVNFIFLVRNYKLPRYLGH